MTPEQLDEIKAREAEATPGPWEKYKDHLFSAFDRYGIMTNFEWPICRGAGGLEHNNASFIAHSREDIPALIAEVERLQDGLAAIEARWREASQDSCFRSHYRETMELCADELRDLLNGYDDSEVQAEIEKAFEAGEA